jgi:plasmid stabilization system protein ParE
MVVFKVSWSPEAVKDVQSIVEFLANSSPYFAKTVSAKLFSTARSLGSFPNAGKVIPGIDDATVREIVVYNYRLVYRVEKYQILIVALVHGKRQ